jgi:hypothetical protein
MSKTLTTFEQDLLHDLRAVVAQRAAAPEIRRRSPRTRTYVGAAGGAAVAAVAGLVLTGGSPAFAVQPSDDGGVTIRIHKLSDAGDLEAALARRGITAVVDYAGRGEAVTIDSGGRVTLGKANALPEGVAPPAQSQPLDSSFGGSATGSCEATATGTSPVKLRRDGDDYVVTLAGPTLTGRNDLTLTTLAANGHDSLVATYSFGTSTCGAMVALP